MGRLRAAFDEVVSDREAIRPAVRVTVGAVLVAIAAIVLTGWAEAYLPSEGTPEYTLSVRVCVIVSLVIYAARQWVLCLRPDAPAGLFKALLVAAYAVALATSALIAFVCFLVPMVTRFASGDFGNGLFCLVFLAAIVAFHVFAMRLALAKGEALGEVVACALSCFSAFILVGIPVLIFAIVFIAIALIAGPWLLRVLGIASRSM